jgi:imidazole glycerol phosphate synthase glutamine amidotransferase subunit
VDLEISNIKNALDYLGISNEIINNLNNMKNISHLILPGVGNFNKCIDILKKKELIFEIKNYVEKKNFLLGICVGMQLLFEYGDEGGGTEGINFFKGSCKRLDKGSKLPLPHIGFNSVQKPDSLIWKGIKENSNFYFVHEYGIDENQLEGNQDVKYGVTKYTNKFISYIENKNGNIFGAQFHPEKSQSNGLKFLRNFSIL